MEAITLFELVKVFERKGRSIQIWGITIILNYKKTNNITQDGGAKIAQIKILLEKIMIYTEFKLLIEYSSHITGFM